MRRFYWSVLLCLTVALGSLVGCSAEEGATGVGKPKDVAKASNEFAIRLYQKLAAGKSENLFFSPYSISSSLALLSAGAEGDTRDQMRDVLHLDMPEAAALSGFQALAESLRSPEEYGFTLQVANRVWTDRSLKLLAPFQKLILANSKEGIGEVDFSTDSTAAAKTINDWVEQETQGKIKEVVSPGVINDTTRLILANAVYFKAKWVEEFDLRGTKLAEFHVSPERTVEVPTMMQRRDHLYAKLPDLELLQLPYEGAGRAASMVILLPSKTAGLEAVERQLSAKNIEKWLADVKGREVTLYLPKFKFTSSFDLNDVLSALGMNLAFDGDNADFSRISAEKPLFLSAVVHQSFVDVNEKGTEAAAVTTGYVISSIEDPLKPVEFRVDRPFIFLIRDRESGTILFLGRVTNPENG
ncbi:MAG: serpin family protein [Planctomycetota bacterium]|nr:serpin family protein [Planctomycetota bacterium]